MKRMTIGMLVALFLAVAVTVQGASQRDLFNTTKGVELAAAAARTTTTTGTGADMTAGTGGAHYRNGVAVVSCGTVTGTSPTNTVTIDGSDDNSTWTAAITTFTQCTAACFESKAVRKAHRYFRSVQTIAGTTPSFTCSVTLLMGDPGMR